MSLAYCENAEQQFNLVSQVLFSALQSNEAATLKVTGEKSHFVRFNQGKVRQCGHVGDASVSIKLVRSKRSVDVNMQLSIIDQNSAETNNSAVLKALADLRVLADAIPEDPFVIFPENLGSSHNEMKGHTLSTELNIDRLIEPLSHLDATGYYAAGPSFRGLANSAGQRHWFSSESFFVDYSLYLPNEKSVKLYYSGNDWDDAKFKKQVDDGARQLKVLEAKPRTVPPGRYRTYLAPAAVSDLVSMFSWHGISEGSLRRGESSLRALRDKSKTLSSQFGLRENFEKIHVPRFNSYGEVATNQIDLISHGKLVNTLISRRTAKEYGVESNGASPYEGIRAPEVLMGKLSEKDILKQLGTGLYLSNLHYLNWSDVQGGRVTGMTRYACFWVENGTIVAPIENLRWDESLYHYFGEGLVGVTDFQELIPDTSTYGERALGGTLVPGMLVDGFTFTL